MTDRYANIRILLREYATAAASWGVDRCDMERLRLERECTPDTIRALVEDRDALAAALEAAREDAAAAGAILRELEADAERYRWMKAHHKGLWLGSDGREYPTLDAAIDQARGKGVADA